MTQRTILGVLATILLVVTLVLLGLVSNGVSAQGNPTPSPDLGDVWELARNFSGSNADWTPVIQEFDGVEMVLVPAGCFMMGSENSVDNEKPVHRVCFEDPFWIDRTEVTNGQFAALNGEAAYASWWSGDERPRENITWGEASAYCSSQGARLPTEAEWEYAARGPDGLEYPWGNEWGANNTVWRENSGGQTVNVGSKPAGVSWVGALDLSGNVREWVSDWAGADYYGTLAEGVVNPTGPVSGDGRVLRGGSWANYYSYYQRSADRDGSMPDVRVSDIGFRCARSMDANSAVPAVTTEPTPEPTPVDPETTALPAGAHNADWTPVIQEFDGVEVVQVPAGCFQMGSTDEQIGAAFQQCEAEYGTGSCDRGWYEVERPAHKVCLDAYWIDRTEVSNGQFAAFNGQAANASWWPSDERPREKITWTEAAAFCERRGARLPTEAEWEYAARGPDGLEYPWGNEWDPDRVVWDGNSNDQTASVGGIPAGASWVGALDMSGNVWEWVADWYGANYYGTLADGVVNPQGLDSGEYRVLRGGSWDDSSSDLFRAAYRNFGIPNLSLGLIGFRCARSW